MKAAFQMWKTNRGWFVVYLFHECLAKTHNLGKEDRVMGEVRAQVAEHAECVPP